ncbi:Muramoyltetrapeptide carboxypeptidase [Pacificimonas flava]|uniref:Muramoyltetrapeptide carboxypeptidase n=2 Tax=Pacificimonas flava TaxID=1234595 RepID=M2TS05_9SPHN|nr:Muramoyltetrapeptide carboxypeptidase [Pacificimonas flava]
MFAAAYPLQASFFRLALSGARSSAIVSPMFDRRTALAGLAAAALPLAPATGQLRNPSPPTATRRAPRLRPGDTVGLVQPAGFVADGFELDIVKETIRAMDLVPKASQHLEERHGYLAGTDRERAEDLNRMYADDTVRAVFAVRGGWGSARILPLLDWNVIAANPKLLIGYSDITALHMAFQRLAGFPTIHGPTGNASWPERSWALFRELAFEGATPLIVNPDSHADRLVQTAYRTQLFRSGKATGPLLGGNLTVLSALVGTPYLPDFAGAILFLEDVGEAPYRIDRMLTQLSLAGILPQVAGVVFGTCSDCTADRAFGGFTLNQVLQQHLQPLGVPAFGGARFGHIADQASLPEGVRAEIDADAGSIRILEPAVAP